MNVRNPHFSAICRNAAECNSEGQFVRDVSLVHRPATLLDV
jgi:hypothetical protein